MTDPFYNPDVPAHVPPELVHDFNIYNYDGEDPFIFIHRMHQAKLPDVFWSRNNGGHWVIFSAAAITEAVMDVKRFSSARPYVPDSANFDDLVFLPLVTDPPSHAGYRRAVAPLLLPNRISMLEGRIRKFTEELATEIQRRGKCEFMSEFASVMPVVVFLQFLDLPLSDKERLLDISNGMVKPKEGEHRNAPLQRFIDYLTPIIDARIANPGTDVISKIVTGQMGDRPLHRDEMIKLTISVMLGGLETTASTLGFIMRHLANTPELRAELIQDSSLIPNAVEELLRRFAPIMLGRIAAEDLTFRGVTMKKNEHLIWTSSMFNLDDRHFPNAVNVDIHRKRTAHHTFGAGSHFCVGHFLARAELKIFLDAWLKTAPNFTVSKDAVINYRTGVSTSLINLPLDVEQARAA